MSEITITVTIADRPYKLKVNSEEEEMVRKAGKKINEVMKEFADNYAYKDKQDLLAMIALQFTTSSLKLESQITFRDHELSDKLAGIDQLLEENLRRDD